MNFKTAQILDDNFELDKDFNIVIKGTKNKLEDPMSKGYVYANLFFYDEVQKEIDKLRALVKKIYNEVALELNINDPIKMLLEISVRARRAIGDDGLDALIKEFLAEKQRHIALMVDTREKMRLTAICEAIFMELTVSFFNMTLQNAKDLTNNVKTFKFSKEYVEKMTLRQKALLSPAIKMIGFENQVKLNNYELAQDFTVKYIPERIPTSFKQQEDTIKDLLKTFIQKHA